MLTFYFIVCLIFSLPIICDFFTDIFMGPAFDAVNSHFEDSHCSFIVWALWKIGVAVTFIVTLGITVGLTLFCSIFFGWIILPIHVVRNFEKYNPFAIWRKQRDEYRKGKS